MTDVPRTSPERPIIWSPGRPATGSRRRPVDVPIQNFCIFVFPVKNSNRCVKQGLLHLKTLFSLNHQFFCWSPKSPLKVPWTYRTLGLLGDLQGRPGDVACRLGTEYPWLYQQFENVSIVFVEQKNFGLDYELTQSQRKRLDHLKVQEGQPEVYVVQTKTLKISGLQLFPVVQKLTRRYVALPIQVSRVVSCIKSLVDLGVKEVIKIYN